MAIIIAGRRSREQNGALHSDIADILSELHS